LALILLARWFIAEIRLDWRKEDPHDPTLVRDYDRDDIRMDILPELSLANVRALLGAPSQSLTFPLMKLPSWSPLTWITAPVPVVPTLKGSVVSNVTLV
jgi:hypothetical protein